ncbi:MAG: HPr family phosphocarrier protein [Gemmatimonadota bacterium]|nr:HPr family phosphocarrier protein [Gemmatimonadota bacterium]MDE3005107.1 HPr family phosphocarrier protein [Gemmatimonadota bacterium]MDE3013479.1 HPr family phosphocarrier protein [Gemmatimonadota bacterium]
MSEAQRVQRTVAVVNPAGMHARPAAELVKLASTFSANIRLSKDGLEVNGKSIMGVLMLAAERGAMLEIIAEGVDADLAVDALSGFVSRGFDEMEV